MKKKPVITQKIRNDRVDQYFGRKWSKCRDVIFDHSLGHTIGAIGGRALHPLQYGVANLAKAYWTSCLDESRLTILSNMAKQAK